MNTQLNLTLNTSSPKQLKKLKDFFNLNKEDGIELESSGNTWQMAISGTVETHKMNLSDGNPYNECLVSLTWNGARLGVSAFQELITSLNGFGFEIESADAAEYSNSDRKWDYYEYQYGEFNTEKGFM